MIVLITGGTGLIGSALSLKLRDAGHLVRILTRHPGDRMDHFGWDPASGYVEFDALDDVDVIVHLSGAGISDHRWTNSYKRELESSRIDTALLLEDALKSNGHSLKHVISISGAGYYGDCGNELIAENAAAGTDFLARLCVKWEDAAISLGQHSEHLSILRLGVVLHKDGAFIRRLEPLVNMYLGAPLGSGKQFVPWIHLTDVTQLIFDLINGKIPQGTYNVASPEQVNNKQLMNAVAKAFNRRVILPPVPEFILRILFGEMKIALVESCRLDVSKLEQSGFKFKLGSLSEALANGAYGKSEIW